MSQRDLALQLIRSSLLSGQVPLGERTSERQFTEKYLGASALGRTPVREALAILTQLGVVEQYPQAGFAVRRIDVEEALKALALQKVTEQLAVQEAANQRLRCEDLTGLVDEFAKAATDGDSSAALEVARTFHMALATSAGYASAADVLGGFRDRYALFVVGSRPLDRHELSESALVYRDLVLAIEADATGEKGEEILDRLIRTEAGFVHARSDSAYPVPTLVTTGRTSELHPVL